MAKITGADKALFEQAIEATVPPKFLELNKRAFELGYEFE